VPLPLLLAIADAPEHEVRAELTHLQAAEFLYETRLFPDLEYTFKHALTHDVAHGGLLHDRQRALHARITEALERLSPERVTEQVERLAHHALRGELWEKAVVYLRQAGLRALARATSREAVTHLEQALGALRRLPETRGTTELTIDIRLDLRNALRPLGERTRIGEHLHQAEVLARRLGDQRRLARIATFMVIQCLGTGDYDEAVTFGQEALSIARTLGDRSIEVVATSFLGVTHIARGEFNDAVALLEPTIGVEIDLRYDRFAIPGIQSAVARGWLSNVLSELGRFDEAVAHAEAAVQIAEEAAGNPWTLYNALYHSALAHFRRGDLPRATRELERNLDLCRTSEIVVGTPIVAATLGAAYALGGRADEALPLVAEAVEDFRSRQMHVRPAFILLYAATSYFAAGRMDEAVSHTCDAMALTRRLGARTSEAHALCLSRRHRVGGGCWGRRRPLSRGLDTRRRARHAPARRPLPPRARQALPAHGQARAGPRAPHHRDDAVPRDGHAVLAGAGGGGDKRAGKELGVVGLRPRCPAPGCARCGSCERNRDAITDSVRSHSLPQCRMHRGDELAECDRLAQDGEDTKAPRRLQGLGAARHGDDLHLGAHGVEVRDDGEAVQCRQQAVAAQAASFSKLGLSNQVVLVNGNIGVVSRRPDGRPFAVLGFTIGSGKIAEIDILADPERLNRLDLSAIES
jgi:tetratricopeptide (TPR) repeat protein